MQYNITGELDIYIIEDIENEIGVFERQRSFDVGEPLFASSRGDSDSLEAMVGKFRNECYVEPDKWVVRLITANFTVGDRKVVAITANDFFDSEGYALGGVPDDPRYGTYSDGAYFTEQQYKTYIFREGWTDATEDDLNRVKKIIAGYTIEEMELDECFEECFDEDDYYDEEDE